MNKTLEFLKAQIGKDVSNSPSPVMRWLNPVLLKVNEGQIQLECLVRPEMTNPFGTLHGGISAAMIDDAVGVAMYSYGESASYITVSNSIDYFSTAQQNETVLIETEVIKKGKQLSNVECSIWDRQKTRLIARGYSCLMKKEL